ncbi:MAG: hypothetical protein KatS3mg097_153 [Candidatus Parcubacteria bacterium]|nr:MAG: hypothetical protein KatS3mg097_153 [Candidatus Parcubacteria bacterium]
MNPSVDYIFLLSRLLLGLFFLMNGVNHFRNLQSLSEYAASKKVAYPKVAVIVTGILLLCGGLSILLGVYPTIGVVFLTIFFIPVTFIMHNFWTIEDPHHRLLEQINFMKNMAIWAGTLLLLFIPQSQWIYYSLYPY